MQKLPDFDGPAVEFGGESPSTWPKGPNFEFG